MIKIELHTATVWACVDCLYAQAGISEDELGEPYPTDPAPLALLDGLQVTSGMFRAEHRSGCTPEDDCECETEDFSSAPCGACGDRLAGSRYALTVWEVK